MKRQGNVGPVNGLSKKVWALLARSIIGVIVITAVALVASALCLGGMGSG